MTGISIRGGHPAKHPCSFGILSIGIRCKDNLRTPQRLLNSTPEIPKLMQQTFRKTKISRRQTLAHLSAFYL